MKWHVIVCLLAYISFLLYIVPAGAQPYADYDKVVIIRLEYHDGTYEVVSKEIRYGKAPNLNLLSGSLKGVISDENGRDITSFSLAEPGIAVGDIMGSPEGDILLGYSEKASAAGMEITLPYLPNMQTFSMYNEQRGTPLVSVDLSPLSPELNAFCTGYPNDPDCECCISPPRASAPETNLPPEFLLLLTSALLFTAIIGGIVLFRMTAGSALPGKKKVLIVDDNPEIVQLIQLFLGKEGYATITASSGEECLATLKKDTPDVILLDILMEPMGGWETLEQIKANPDTKTIPALMLTGKALTPAEAKRYQICIEDYIMKPFLKDELFASIEHVLTRKKKIKDTIALAKRAGVDKNTFCEFARLSKRVDVNNKLIELLQKTYPNALREDVNAGDINQGIEEMIANARLNETHLEQLKLKINSAFMAKGYPLPSL